MARRTFSEAALLGALGASTIGTVLLWLQRPSGAATVVLLFVLTTIGAIACAFTIGAAWHRFALARSWTGPAYYLVPATIIGLMLGWLQIWCLTLWAADEGGASSGIAVFNGLAPYGGGVGFLTALIAWAIRRPDRDANPAKTTT